ncbi:MAG: FAD-dependent oxidoreductase, partial [Gammaproteobacteria bacterium]
MQHQTCDVLVVGAGPAGLTAATALARHGIDVLVVERHAGTSPFPKATGVSTRTMELLRSWGLEQRVRAGAMHVRPGLVVSDTLTGTQRDGMEFGYPTDAQALAVSPTTPCYCPQDHLEPVLLTHLRARGGCVRFGTELADWRTDGTGVQAELRDRATGRLERVQAQYLIGADGPRSSVCSMLGLGADDLGTIGEFIAVTFRADPLRRDPAPAGDGLASDIGARYRSAVVEAGTGERASHAWVRRGGHRISTLDLFDGRLTVLTGPRGGPWRRAVTEIAANGLPIVALTVGRDLDDEDGAFARHYRLGDAGAALVRPDGYLAWRRPGPG